MLEAHETMDQKMNIDVITSFNKTYYDIIGHACVASWLTNWPDNLTLTVYLEDMSWTTQDRITIIDFDELGQDYIDFQNSDEKARVKTFAKKAYSIIHAFNNSTADRIVWLDADVVTEQPIPFDVLANLCSDQQLTAHMPVEHEGYFSVETGIFCVNTRHPSFHAFALRYQERYNLHIRHDLRRFYDGEVFGACVKEFDVDHNNLCAGLQKNYKTPLKHTILGPYLRHYKAKHNKDYFVQVQYDS